MAKYRLNWNTIIKNVVIALTGLGALLIGFQLAYSKYTTGRATFFFQKPQTDSEGYRDKIQSDVDTAGKIYEMPEESNMEGCSIL